MENLVDYNYADLKMKEKINTPYDFQLKFSLMRWALGVSNTDEDGIFKDMDTYFSDLATAYIKYKHER